jgi:hypothetical protein
MALNWTDPPEVSGERAQMPLSVVATSGANRAGTDVPGTPGDGKPAHETADAAAKAKYKRR